MNSHNKPQKVGRFLALLLLVVFWLAVGQAYGATASGYSEYYIPGDEDFMFAIFDDINNVVVAADGMHTIISVTAYAGDTTIYYDHWEDGYDFDPNLPVSTADESFPLTGPGDVAVFEESNIPLPRATNLYKTPPPDPTYYHDGRDRIYVSGGAVTVVRISWTETSGTLMCAGWEVYPVRPQLTTYINPFGEDLARDDAKQYWDFDRVYTMIQATNDNTVIQVDLNNDGVYDQLDWDRNGTIDGTATTLNRGEVILLDRVAMGDQAINGATVNGSTADNLLIAGTRIQASDTIQLQYVVGDEGSNYEVRGFSAFPRGFWDTEYFAPVRGGAPANNGDSDIYLYNPNDTVLRIDYQTGTGSGWFTIDPKTTRSYFQGTGGYVPQTSGVYLRGSDVFWGVATLDTSGTDNTDGGAGRTHEWGYNLVPSFLLDNEHFMGWAPGSYPTGTGGDADNSGVYITSASGSIRLFVDYDPTDANPYDVYYDLGHLDSQYIFDPNDGDMTNAHLYATGPFTGAFGQNPDLAPAAAPAIDTGYMLLPGSDFIDLVLGVTKSADPVVLPTGPYPLDTDFTLEVITRKYNVDGIEVVDVLPDGWEYVDDTTLITFPDGSTASTDPTLSGTDDRTLTWDDTVLGNMAPNQKLSVTFTAQTTRDFAEGDLSRNDVTVTGSRTVEGVTQTFTTTDFAFVAFSTGSLGITKSSDVAAAAYPGDTVNYTVTVTNTGTIGLQDISLYDPLPAGVTYVAGSATVTGPVTENVRDEFASIAFDNDNGSLNWSGAWAETDTFGAGADVGAVWITGGALQFRAGTGTNYWADNFDSVSYSRQDGNMNWADNWDENNDDDSPSGGDIRVDGTNFWLEFRQNTDADDSIQRSATVTGATNLTISYYFGDTGLDPNDDMIVEYYDGTSWTTTRRLDGNSNNQTYTDYIIWTPTDTTITLRFRAEDAIEAGEEARFDTVRIIDTTPNAAAGTLVSRAADTDGAYIATLSFSYSAANLEAGDTVVVEVSPDGSAFTILETFDGPSGGGTRTYDLVGPPNYTSATTTVRFRVTGGIDAADEYFNVDDVDITFTEITTVAANDPTSFVIPADNFDLASGQSLTLTFQTVVDAPLATGITEITNTASATCAEILAPVSASVTDPVVNVNQGSGTVGDRVWLDANGNGLLDVGEPGIPNVEVTLKDQYGTPLQTMLTNSIGYYLFTGVTLDEGYYVEITDGLPSGLTQTTDGRTDNRTDSFNLEDIQNYRDTFSTVAYTNWDGSIDWSANAWTEVDGGGGGGAGGGDIFINAGGALSISRDVSGTENSIRRTFTLPAGIDSATLAFNWWTSTGVDATDSIILDISTDGGGSYTTLRTYTGITGFQSGSETIDLTAYASASSRIIRFRTNTYTAGDEDFYVDNFDITYRSSNAVDVSYLEADLGYEPDPGSAIIGDLVWSDANSNGIRDPGEPGLAGVTVRLYTDANGNGVIDGGEVFVETESGAGGSYLFSGVTATGTEDYIVWVDQTDLAAYDITTPPSGIFSLLNVTAGGAYLNADFGFIQDTPGATYDIADRIWRDNGTGGGSADDGAQNGTEAGLAGVTVELLDDSLNVIAVAVTDSDGDFTFTGVPAGVRYSWRVTDQAGVLSGYYGTTSSAQSGSFQMPGVLSGDLDYTLSPNFGYNVARGLGDTVFNDNGQGDGGTADDGIRNGDEPGISGVTVTLYRDVDNDGVFEPGGDDGVALGSLVTDADGKYLFSGLADGWYWVSLDSTQAALTGFSLSPTAAPADDSAVAGHQQREQVSGGVSNFDADFGYVAPDPGSLSGTLWEDGDVDGTIDTGEALLANVTVDLIRGGVVIATAVTDASGNYAFIGLPASVAGVDYTIRVTDGNGYLSGYETVYERSEGTTSPFDGEEDETLTSNENVTGINFGYFKPNPTVALISYFKVVMENGTAVAEWETVSQIGTLGFSLVRRDGSGGVMPVTDRPIPALIYPHGGAYRCVDRDVAAGETRTYELRELEASGITRSHGPYTVTVNADAGSSRAASVDDDLFRLGYSRSPRAVYAEKEGADGDMTIKPLTALAGAMAFPKIGQMEETEGADLDTWVALPTSISRVSVPAGPLTGIRDIKIFVDASGLYQVTAVALAAALNVSEADVVETIAGRKIRLSNLGQPVAYYPAADNSGIFFYGEKYSSIYTDRNVYWLKLMPESNTGDLNADGRVDRNDLVIAMAVMNGEPAVGLRPDFAASGADVDGNGKVDMAELAYIRNALAGVMSAVSGDVPDQTGEGKYFTATLHFEEETFYKTDVPVEIDDFWFWDFYTLGNPEFGGFYGFDPFPLDVPDVAPGDTHTAELTVFFQGLSNHGHRAQVALNPGTGNELNLGEVIWNGYDPAVKTFSFNQAKLVGGANTVKVRSLKNDDSFGVDAFDLTYQRTYTAVGDRLEFTAGGNDLITVSGFTGHAPPAGRVGALREVHGGDVVEAGGFQVPLHGADQVGMEQRRLALRRQHAAGGQCAPAVAVEVHAEQARSRADRVGGVDQDDVVAARLGIRHPGDTVLEVKPRARVEARRMQGGKVDGSGVGDRLVELDHVHLLDAVVLEHLAQRAAVTAADDQHALRVLVREQRRVHQHLVVHELVPLGHHDQAVEGHELAEARGLEHFHALVGRLEIVNLFLYFQ